VEVLYGQVAFGRESNTTGTVTVGSPVRPVLGEFALVRFVGLSVEVQVIRASGSLAESWRAEVLAEGKPEDKPAGSTQAAASGGRGGVAAFADQTMPDGSPRYVWANVEANSVEYVAVIAASLRQAREWRGQYERAKSLAAHGSPPVDTHSATTPPAATDAA